MFGTLQIGHTIHEGHQRLQCWPFPNMAYHGYNREDFVFTRPPGVERFVLSPDNVWYVAMKIRNNVYLGYFKSLSWTQDASKPFHWNFEFTFQVEKTVVSMYYPQGGSTTTSTTPAFNGEVTATIIPTSTTPTPTTPTPTPTPPKPAPVDTSGS